MHNFPVQTPGAIGIADTSGQLQALRQPWTVVQATVAALEEVLQDGVQAVIQGSVTGAQGCALIQAMDCLIMLIKQERKSNSTTHSNPFCCWWSALILLHSLGHTQ